VKKPNQLDFLVAESDVSLGSERRRGGNRGHFPAVPMANGRKEKRTLGYSGIFYNKNTRSRFFPKIFLEK